MQQLVDYIRSTAGTYPRAAIDAQLRAAGHPETAILAAWEHAMSQSTVAVAPPPTRQPAGAATTIPAGRVLLVLVILVVTIAATLLVLSAGTSDGVERISDSELAEGIADGGALTKDQAAEVVDLLGGAELRGTLPSGWSEAREGVWMETRTGNSVNVVTLPRAEGATIESEIEKAMPALERLGLQEVTKEPHAAKLDGVDVTRTDFRIVQQGIEIDMTQYYVLAKDEFTVVTASRTPLGKSSAAEVDAVVKQLDLT